MSVSNATTSTTSVPPSHVTRRLLIDADNLVVRRNAEDVLDDVSLCIHSGEFIGLIGPNGAGKTTLLHTILGIIQPLSGSVTRHSKALGYVAQGGDNYNGIVPMSVLEVVQLGSGGSKPVALNALNMVGLDDVASRRLSDLSGGQRQRVIIAKALAGNAELLILDEPATGIDSRSQTEFYSILRSLRKQGVAIILVAHELDIVMQHADRIICINHSIRYDGPVASFDAETHAPDFYTEQHHTQHHGARHV